MRANRSGASRLLASRSRPRPPAIRAWFGSGTRVRPAGPGGVLLYCRSGARGVQAAGRTRGGPPCPARRPFELAAGGSVAGSPRLPEAALAVLRPPPPLGGEDAGQQHQGRSPAWRRARTHPGPSRLRGPPAGVRTIPLARAVPASPGEDRWGEDGTGEERGDKFVPVRLTAGRRTGSRTRGASAPFQGPWRVGPSPQIEDLGLSRGRGGALGGGA